MPGQTFCAEQPSFPKDILAHMWFSMPSAPGWMTNFTTNLTSGLLDTKKYLLYGGGVFLAALLSYIGYKIFSSSDSKQVPTSEKKKNLSQQIPTSEEEIDLFTQVPTSEEEIDLFTQVPTSEEKIDLFTQVPTSMDNRDFWKPNYKELSSRENCSNIAYIIRWYNTVNGDEQRELAFQHYVCPVLKAHENELSSKQQWENFLKDIHSKALRITMTNMGASGLNMFQLMKRTCPNETIVQPLRELLIEHIKDDQALKILNQ